MERWGFFFLRVCRIGKFFDETDRQNGAGGNAFDRDSSFPNLSVFNGQIGGGVVFLNHAALVLCVFFVFAAGAFGSALCREDRACASRCFVLIGTFPLVTAYGVVHI